MIIKRLIGWDCFDYAILLKIKTPSRPKLPLHPPKSKIMLFFISKTTTKQRPPLCP